MDDKKIKLGKKNRQNILKYWVQNRNLHQLNGGGFLRHLICIMKCTVHIKTQRQSSIYSYIIKPSTTNNSTVARLNQ